MIDTKIDKKTENTLLRALHNAKAHSRQMQMRREKELWKQIDTPCRLIDVLSLLKKNELDSIRKRLDLKGLSSLNKGALASELERLIPANFKKILHMLDQERYDLIRKIVSNSRYSISNSRFTISKVESLMEWGIIFPGVDQDQKFLTMPSELMDLFTKMDGPELKNIIRRNTEWIHLTHGMLYYYGVMDTSLVLDKMSQLTQQEVDSLDYLRVFSSASNYYKQAKFSYKVLGLEDHRVHDAKELMDEQNKKAAIDYYPFTKEQLSQAGEPGFIERTPSMVKFLDFLFEHYDLTHSETEDIALELINIINLDEHPSMTIKYLSTRLEFPTFEFVQEITALVMELYNQTRMWVLKGYAPSELAQEEKKHLLPLPSDDENKKVGRNDPCPCGSGKKYKKCCGK
jgi:hypothetical protein